MRRVFALLISFAVATCLHMHAGTSGSEGTDFRYCSMPGVHATSDSIFLVLSSTRVATGSIEYTSAQGQPVQRFFSVSDPRRAVYIAIPRTEVELQGMRRDSSSFQPDQSETVLQRQVIRIHSDSSMNVAVLSNGTAGSCATMLMPIASSGLSYVLSSSAARVVADSLSQPDKNLSTASQCVIIATEDATRINLRLKGRSSHGSEGVQSIQLNANECYFIQSALDTSASVSDLSATQITSNRPVVVLSGHQAARLPEDKGFSATDEIAGEYAIQLSPVDRWGTDFVLVPTQTTESTLQSGAEFVRVYAIRDNTEIWLNGVLNKVLNDGEYGVFPLNSAETLHASAAVSVIQYSGNAGPKNQLLGNATMFSVTAMNQWTTEHTICALQTRRDGNKMFGSQYVMIIAPDKAMKSVLYDGEPAASAVQQVGTSAYSYFIRKIADGIHTISCDSACGVYVYGFGPQRRYVLAYDLEFPQRAFMRPYLSVPNCSAAIGDTVTVSVSLDSLLMPPAILGLQPASYSFDLCFNSTVLTPADPSKRGVIERGVQMVHYSDTLSQFAARTQLVSIPMICGLGDAEESRIQVDNFHWYSKSGDTIQLDYTPAFGLCRVKNVWHDHDGARLVNPQPGDLRLDVTPNPAHGKVFITCKSDLPATVPPSLVLYNAMGEVVVDLSQELRAFSRAEQFTYNTQDLSPGVYYLRFALADKSVVIMVVNE